MSDPLPAITEAQASGAIADLFADIRATVGVRVVNLVWRHLATMEGALPWAWAAVKPLYLDGLPDAAMATFRQTMDIPRLTSLAGEEPASVDAVLASYDHSNTINLFALGALRAWLNGQAAGEGAIAPAPRKPAPDLQLPKLASEEDVDPATWAMVLQQVRRRAAAADPGQHVPPPRACAGLPAARGGSVGAGRRRRLFASSDPR